LARSIRNSTTNRITKHIVEDNLTPSKAAALVGVNNFDEYLQGSETLKSKIDKAVAQRDLNLTRKASQGCVNAKFILKHLYPSNATIQQKREKEKEEETKKKIMRIRPNDLSPHKTKQTNKTIEEIGIEVDERIEQEKTMNKRLHGRYVNDFQLRKLQNNGHTPSPLYMKICNHYWPEEPIEEELPKTLIEKVRLKPKRVLKKIRRSKIV